MRIREVVVLLSAFWAAGLAQAEIYRWRDADGRIHYSDMAPSEVAAQTLELRPINTITSPRLSRLDELFPRQQEVVIYTAQWCGVCTRAKAYFAREGIPYQEYDVENDARGRRDFRRLSGTGVPIILVGDRRMDGFDPVRFERILEP